MKVYGNDFVTGRELAKKIAILVALFAGFGILLGFINPLYQMVVSIFAVILMITLFVVVYKRCVCPHCGKHIVLGVLQATTCPRCKRSLISGRKVKR